MIRDFLSLPFQSPVIISQSDGWGLTSWMLKHRGRGWPSFPRKNRCGGLCGNQVQAPHAIASGWFPHGRWRRTALAHLVGAELVHERVVEREVRAVRVEEPLLVVVRRRQLLPPLRVGDERARREVRVGHVGHVHVPPEHGAAYLGLQVALEQEHIIYVLHDGQRVLELARAHLRVLARRLTEPIQ